MRTEIRSDGRVVWVNGSALLGRFSRQGIDVHIDGVCAGDGCVPGPCTKKHWRIFQEQMLKVHKVKVSDKHRPKNLAECCDMMQRNLDYKCEQHRIYPLSCSDTTVITTKTGYGILIHDGTESYIAIKYCPWCATQLTDPNAPKRRGQA